MLALEIEYLTGNVVAASSSNQASLDWPPQPDRVFSALVASWGARGRDENERHALEWLERQHPPRILADEARARNVVTVYVPPNDFKTSKNGKFDVLPERRQGQERHFPTGRLCDPIVRMVWAETPDPSVREALDAMARDTAYIGHSSSLTRCRFTEDEIDLQESLAPTRTVYQGRLAELERAFNAGRRPGPGDVVVPVPAELHPGEPRSVFSEDWIVFSGERGDVPDLRAMAIIAKKMRDALMEGYTRAYQSAAPEWLSGHGAGGRPSANPHTACVPMAFLGSPYADGRILGCAIVLPRSIRSEELFDTIGALLGTNSGESPHIELGYAHGKKWYLSPEGSGTSKASLVPGVWTKSSRLWATATPIALDRYPKKRDLEERAQEIAEVIAQACVSIGLPRPSYVGTDGNSLVEGAPSAHVGDCAPAWQRWQLPQSLKGRYLTHAVIGFDEPVRGPVLLGAGRYIGLGLCRPIHSGSHA